MGRVIPFKKTGKSGNAIRASFRRITKTQTAAAEDESTYEVEGETVKKGMPMRWGWTLGLWLNVYWIYTAAVGENMVWFLIHCALAWWTLGVRRNNDALVGSKHW